jgi:hypothetical protein
MNMGIAFAALSLRKCPESRFGSATITTMIVGAIGGPLTIWIGYRPREVRFQKGHPNGFSKTRGVTRYFCGDCGTSIAYVDKGLPNEIYVSVGFMDNPERFPPAAQAYWEMRLPFVVMDDGLPRVDVYTRPRDPAFKNYPRDR